MMQPDLFTPHESENNASSQRHLNENRHRFSQQCAIVYNLLMCGKVLTVISAMNTYNVMSLPRRILDIKKLGFKISDQWSAQHKIKIKEYFMCPEDITHNKTHYNEANNQTNNTQGDTNGAP